VLATPEWRGRTGIESQVKSAPGSQFLSPERRLPNRDSRMQFLNRLKTSWPPESWRDVTIIVAVSGGADSVSLLCGLAELRDQQSPGKLVAAHFNHRLREASDSDAQFVQHLAKKVDVECEVGTAPKPLEQSGGDGVEAVARSARYDFLLKTAEKFGARYVATAHTADDQAETILHRVLRGTGLAGLAGIPRTRQLNDAVTLIRPLLEFSRNDVVEYLAARHQSFCLDESNEDPSYTRNRIRHALLPQLAAQYNPQVRKALLRLGQLAGEAQHVVEQRTGQLLEQSRRQKCANQVIIDCTTLRPESPHLICETLIQLWKDQSWPLQQMGMTEWNALANLVTQHSDLRGNERRLNLPGNIRAIRSDGYLELTRTL
jgi:tRNA(Ile)-lysidine synthase